MKRLNSWVFGEPQPPQGPRQVASVRHISTADCFCLWFVFTLANWCLIGVGMLHRVRNKLITAAAECRAIAQLMLMGQVLTIT